MNTTRMEATLKSMAEEPFLYRKHGWGCQTGSQFLGHLVTLFGTDEDLRLFSNGSINGIELGSDLLGMEEDKASEFFKWGITLEDLMALSAGA